MKLTPFPVIGFIFLMTAARTILGIAINLVVLFTGILFFNVAINLGQVLALLGMMFIGILCFTCLGFLISNFAHNEGQISIISNLLFMPMIFGTDTFYSLHSAPGWVVKMGELFPLGYYVHGLRSALGTSNMSFTGSVMILVIFTFALLLLSAITFNQEGKGQIRLKKVMRNPDHVA